MIEAARISSSIAERGVVRSMVVSLIDLAASLGSAPPDGSFVVVVVSDTELVPDGFSDADVSLQTEMRDPLRFRIFRILSGIKSVVAGSPPNDGVAGRDPDVSEFASLRMAAVRSADPDLVSSRCGLVIRQLWHSHMPDGMSCS